MHLLIHHALRLQQLLPDPKRKQAPVEQPHHPWVILLELLQARGVKGNSGAAEAGGSNGDHRTRCWRLARAHRCCNAGPGRHLQRARRLCNWDTHCGGDCATAQAMAVIAQAADAEAHLNKWYIGHRTLQQRER
jgi:hypothetical protein